MAVQGAYTLNSPVASGDTSKPLAVRDPLIRDAQGGVRFLFDTAFGWCYPGGGSPLTRPAPGAPANAAVIYDMAERGNGAVALPAGQTISYAGGGFDFSAITVAADAAILAPAGALASIADDQYFAVISYDKWPTEADWMGTSGIFPNICATATLGGYVGEVDLLTIGQRYNAGAKTLTARRQTNGGSTVQTIEVPAAVLFGRLAQTVYYRTASGIGLRVLSAAGEAMATDVVGANNTGDFTGKQIRFGSPMSFSVNGASTARKRRLYRGSVIDMTGVTTSIIDIANADWARVQARIAASATANGGTSTIFN